MSRLATITPKITLKDWASNVEAKKKLQSILADPVMVMALDLLSQDVSPTTVVQKVDGISFMESVAMTNTYRAGGNDKLRALKALPYVLLKEQQEAILGRPYEWLGSEEDKKLVKEKK